MRFAVRLVATGLMPPVLVLACSGTGASTNAVATHSGSGAGTSTGAAGSGGAAACEPNAVRDCYTGPEGTEGVGVCRAGVETCLADGSAWGPCEGEVVPTLEVCNTLDDDDCDGKVNEAGDDCVCKPKASAYCYDGDPKTENIGICVGGIRVCSDDGTAWGPCVGQVLPGMESCSTPEDEDCDGKNPLCPTSWLLKGGDGNDQIVNAMAVDASGNVVVVGEFEGTMTLGNLTLTSAGGYDAFVVKIAPNGTVVWGGRYGDPTQSQGALAVAVDAQGNVLIGGYFRASINFGGGALTASTNSDPFVAKLSGTNGAQLWARAFTGVADDQYVTAVAFDAAGDAYAAGTFAGSINFGVTLNSVGLQDAFIGRLSGATGTPVWAQRFGGTDHEVPRDIVTDGQSGLVAIGDFYGAFSLAGQNLASAGLSDVFLARFDSLAGTPLLAKRFGGTGFDLGRALTLSKNGGPVLGGDFDSSIDFGGGVMKSVGGADLFLAEFDLTGNHLQSKRFGGVGDESVLDLARDPNGNLVLGGFTTGSIDFGGGKVTSAGGRDALSAKLSSSFAPQWTRLLGDATFYQQTSAVGVLLTGDSVLAGHFSGKANFGGGEVTATGGTDAFVVSYPQ